MDFFLLPREPMRRKEVARRKKEGRRTDPERSWAFGGASLSVVEYAGQASSRADENKTAATSAGR